MTTLSLRRKTLFLLFVAVLVLPWPSVAAPRRALKTTASAPSTILDRAWSSLQRLWSDTGCWIDPSGRCLTGATQVVPPAPPKASTNLGCWIDPNGRCTEGASKPSTDTGCVIDPGGRCHS